ncbi:fused MFS/spermidine synthase [Vibrio sp. SS-MA-C1-2]|uniref:spermidine synthase n=1 Tax=Vibrio sp. SS-MA-C1-2 TaxID=2908646 RepID=UPI001F1F7440|nr:fused MFS/spermidine synthase [Vibrio sp. SS-MA-C1-2]
MNTRVYAYATILATFLTGLAIGNFFASRKKITINQAWNKLALVTILSSLTAIIPIYFVNANITQLQLTIKHAVYDFTQLQMTANLVSFLFISAFFVIIPTFFFGCVFPYALRIAKSEHTISDQSGKLLAANTIAGVLASVLITFIAIPMIGIIWTIKVIAFISLIAGIYCLLRSHEKSKVVITCATVLFIGLVILPHDKLVQLLLDKEGGHLIWYNEGIGNTVAVIEQGQEPRTFRRLFIQGVSNTGDIMASKRYMRLQTYLPLLIHDNNPKSALVIALGTGITAGAMTNYPTLEHRDVFELLPEVIEGTKYFSGNYNVGANPNINIIAGDGRHQLMKSDHTYDMITLEPPPPTAVGVSNLYSADFYKLAKKHLNKGGMLAQWWPIATQTVNGSKSIVSTMLSQFRYVSLWSTEMHEMLLIGSDTPQKIDSAHINNVMLQSPKLRESLKEVGISNSSQLLATYMADTEALKEFVNNAPLITDNYPLLEFDPWSNESVITEIMPTLLKMQSLPPSLPQKLKISVDKEQQNLRFFYIAGMAAYEGQEKIGAQYMKWVFDNNPDNAYFQWFNPKRK